MAKLYGRTAALKALSLRVEPDEILAVLGPNGSGKTTLLKILAGAITPTLGHGSIFGHDLVSGRIELRRQIGFLASETYLYDDLTAEENLRFILTMAGSRPERRSLAAALDRVSLGQHASERVRGFSSGMKRRLSIARLLLLRPRLLLLDEPYNSLDAAGIELVDETIRQVAGQGGVVVVATHDAERALALAGLVAELDRGALTYLGNVPGFEMRHAQHVG